MPPIRRPRDHAGRDGGQDDDTEGLRLEVAQDGLEREQHSGDWGDVIHQDIPTGRIRGFCICASPRREGQDRSVTLSPAGHDVEVDVQRRSDAVSVRQETGVSAGPLPARGDVALVLPFPPP